MTNRLNIKYKVVVALMFWPFFLQASQAQVDSSAIFTYDELISNILLYHPLAKKANLKDKLGEATILAARGQLDPKLTSGMEKKEFDGKLYYQTFASKLTIPTPIGIDVVGGYEDNEGVNLNPQNLTDENGLWHAGVELNVLQGLWNNERRTAVKQAKVYKQMANNEKQISINELIYNASYYYITWQKYYYYNNVLNKNIQIASKYLNNIRESFLNGEKTALDTIEAFILYQDAINTFNKNELKLVKSKNTVENYLWIEEYPVALQNNVTPENYINTLVKNVDFKMVSNLSSIPEIQLSSNKISYLNIEQKLKKDKLKPKLKLKYNALLSTSDKSISPNYSASNIKWGFDFSMPLLFRKERGNIKKGLIKIEEEELSLDFKKTKLQNKLETSIQNKIILEEQIKVLEKSVDGYKKLLDGEFEKLRFGESSVFILNKRQEKYTTGQLKLIDTYIQVQLEIINFLYLSNQLI